MKLHLLHGPGIISSRSKLQTIKKSFDSNNVITLGSETPTEEIIGRLLTQSVFREEMLIILENPPENLNFDFKNSTNDFTTLLIWIDHEIGLKSPALKFIKDNGGQILFFEEAKETSVFPFLDHLALKDQNAFIELQKLKKSGFDIFYILTMTFYLLRNLVSTPISTPEFVRKKLTKQRFNFNPDRIEKLYRNTLEIEFKLKKGLLDGTQAEFLLINSFMN